MPDDTKKRLANVFGKQFTVLLQTLRSIKYYDLHSTTKVI